MTMLFDSDRAAAAPAFQTAELGSLPQWRLEDLYESMESPRFSADMERAEREAKVFAGRLARQARGDRRFAGRGRAARRGGARHTRRCRTSSAGSCPMLRCCMLADTSDPARAKFYGDAQESVTALSGDLLFFELELNRIDDAKLDAAMAADSALAHYRPWLEDIRKEKPHQLADEIEQLFLEKSVSGAAAWNRLFDETIVGAAFRLRGREPDARAAARQAAGPRREQARGGRQRARRDAGRKPAALRARSRTRSPRTRRSPTGGASFEDVADSRHLANRVEREVVEALVAAVTDAYPRLSHRYYALKARWFGKEKLEALGPQCAAARRAAARLFSGGRARHGARRLSRLFAAHGRHRAALLRRRLDRRAGAGPARRRAPSRIRRRRRRIPTCSSIISASRAT